MLSDPFTGVISSDDVGREFMSRCIAGCEHLLFIVVEEAVRSTHDKNSENFRDFELLISCLETTDNFFVQEVILNVLMLFKSTHPEVLLATLSSKRFAETTALKILIDSKLPLHIHKLTLNISIWSLWVSCSAIPDQIMKYRLANSKILADVETISKTNSGSDQQHLEVIRFCSILKPCLKSITTVNMLAESIRIACKENTCHSFNGKRDADNKTFPMTDILTDINQLKNGDDPNFVSEYDSNHYWLVLPFFPCALVLSDLSNAQSLLMSLCINLKTDEIQSEMLSAISDEIWLEIFINMIVVSYNLDNGSEENSTISSNCVELTIDALGRHSIVHNVFDILTLVYFLSLTFLLFHLSVSS